MLDISEKQLVERLKMKDEEAFRFLVQLYKEKVIYLCYSYTEDFHEGEDLSQEIFISLYKSIINFRSECSLSTYIYKITLSRCVDYKRKKSIKCFLKDITNISAKEYEISQVDEKQYVMGAINKLPIKLKQVIVLYYYIGLSQKEIGEVLNISPKNVEGRIYRAKQALKKQLIERS